MPPSPSENPDKLPPQSIEAEQSVLGCLMIDKDGMYKIADMLRPEDFYRGTHKTIFSSMLTLYDKREPIDILSLSQRLKGTNQFEEAGGHSYLTELVGRVPTATHIVHYAKIVKHKRILRDLIAASYDIGQLGYNEQEEIDVLLDKAEARVFQISQQTLSQGFVPFKQELEQAFNRIDQLHNHDTTLRGIPTGFADLDLILAGLQKSDLVILAARPSHGKSSLALDITRHAAIQTNLPVGLFSLEMSKDQLIDRMLAAYGNVDLWRLRTGKLSSHGEENDFVKLQYALDGLSRAPIFIDDAASANMLQIRAMARRLQAEHGLGLVVVDYLQLIQPRNPSDPVVQQVTEISRSLKALARELNVPVLALSQLSRAVEQRGGRPRLSDLRDSGCLTGDTLIQRADTGERIPIKDLVGKTDVPLLSLDNTYRLRPTLASKIFSSGVKQTYRLTTKSGRTIKASGNHTFFSFMGWQRLDALQQGDRIALPRAISLTPPTTPLSQDELILLAHLIGDGCVLPRQPIHYTSADEMNLAVVEHAAQKLFGITARRVHQKNWWHAYLPSPYRLTHGKHHPITNWYRALGLVLVRSYEKHIPRVVFESRNQDIALFLKHLWATDGNISWKILADRMPSAAIYYATTSNALAQDVQHLLLRLGIWSSVRKIAQGIHRPCYQVHIQSAPVQQKFLEEVGCFGGRATVIPEILAALKKIASIPNNDTVPQAVWKLFVAPEKERSGMSWRGFADSLNASYNGTAITLTGVSRPRLHTIAKILGSAPLAHLAESDVYWDEVASVEPLGWEEVYDATVPGTHNFIAGDIIVHNSIEQDADVVLFIHRENKPQDEGVKDNIAEIIVAKHRNGPTGKVNLYFDERVVSFQNLTKEGLEQNMQIPSGGEATPEEEFDL